MIFSTNWGGSKAMRISFRRVQNSETTLTSSVWHSDLVLGPFTALYRSFPKRELWLMRRLGLYDRLDLTFLEVRGFWTTSPPIISRDSVSLCIWARIQTARSIAYFNGCPYLWYTIILHYMFCTTFYDLSLLVGWWSSIRRSIYKFLNVCPFDNKAVAISFKIKYS